MSAHNNGMDPYPGGDFKLTATLSRVLTGILTAVVSLFSACLPLTILPFLDCGERAETVCSEREPVWD